MSLKKFGDKDVFVNTMRAFPSCDFTIFDSKVIYNNVPAQSGSRNSEVRNVDTGAGYISLYEWNIDRPYVDTGRYVGVTASNTNIGIADTGIIYPFISKDSARSSFKTVNEVSYNNEFQYGDILTSSYPLAATITREFTSSAFTSTSSYNAHYVALRNRLQYYRARSSHYAVNGPHGNKDAQALGLISIPSIFYGSRIKPGTLSLKWYFTGSLIGELQDTKKNGELVQVFPTAAPETISGSVGGVALYEEGILLLTGSWALNTEDISLQDPGANDKAKWIYFGAGMNDGVNQSSAGGLSFTSASFNLSFKGQTDTQVMTMFAHAKRGEVNYSNNPTFLEYGQTKTFLTSSHIYEEFKDLKLKNFVSSSHSDYSASFKRQVFVSRIAVYDRNKNLIGIATLANPILKKEAEDVSFKLKLDI